MTTVSSNLNVLTNKHHTVQKIKSSIKKIKDTTVIVSFALLPWNPMALIMSINSSLNKRFVFVHRVDSVNVDICLSKLKVDRPSLAQIVAWYRNKNTKKTRRKYSQYQQGPASLQWRHMSVSVHRHLDGLFNILFSITTNNMKLCVTCS